MSSPASNSGQTGASRGLAQPWLCGSEPRKGEACTASPGYLLLHCRAVLMNSIFLMPTLHLCDHCLLAYHWHYQKEFGCIISVTVLKLLQVAHSLLLIRPNKPIFSQLPLASRAPLTILVALCWILLYLSAARNSSLGSAFHAQGIIIFLSLLMGSGSQSLNLSKPLS